MRRADTLALTVGSRMSVSTLMLACVLVIVIGANSMLSSLKAMDADVKLVNQQLAITNKATDELNRTLDSLPPTSEHLKAINQIVGDTAAEVDASAGSLAGLASATSTMDRDLSGIAGSTRSMGGSLASVDSSTSKLSGTLVELDRELGPTVAAQHQTRVQAEQIPVGIFGMNDRLGYVIRQLNYIAAPPGGGAFTIRPTLDPATLPPVPGLRATADPTAVFPRNVWPVYRGP